MDRIRQLVEVIVSVLLSRIEALERLDVDRVMIRTEVANLHEGVRMARAGLALLELALANRAAGTAEEWWHPTKFNPFEMGKFMVRDSAEDAGLILPGDAFDF